MSPIALVPANFDKPSPNLSFNSLATSRVVAGVAGVMLSGLLSGTSVMMAPATIWPTDSTQMTAAPRTTARVSKDWEFSTLNLWTRMGASRASEGKAADTASVAAKSVSEDASVPLSGPSALRWLHEHSGLTWDQIGRMFNVSRRAVHLWVSGGRMNAANAETLAKLVTLVRDVDKTAPEDRRSALFAADSTGRSMVDRFLADQASRVGEVSGTPFSVGQLLGVRHGDVGH